MLGTFRTILTCRYSALVPENVTNPHQQVVWGNAVSNVVVGPHLLSNSCPINQKSWSYSCELETAISSSPTMCHYNQLLFFGYGRIELTLGSKLCRKEIHKSMFPHAEGCDVGKEFCVGERIFAFTAKVKICKNYL
jgi:hypothetical protein